ncbi:uncharacterized protein FSUBG_13501 [Fusarium subglutinans]|uniref:Uncharacterized protein n=1 Tax=Gibberella subglutinans TaxID=42677 RepID=A0A8H5KUC3_GIBSU|nr:uncharacterized protein FSUBG_13501 [Fusarium subglutinans]KAF5580062.1 hypothetical protein FSUBG_13501 [Fusarium subglutinans]
MARTRKRKAIEALQDEPRQTTETQSSEDTLSPENEQLRAEIKLLKDTLTDLRNSIETKDMLIKELQQSRDALEKLFSTVDIENERLRESRSKEKTPEDTRSRNERLQSQMFDVFLPKH